MKRTGSSKNGTRLSSLIKYEKARMLPLNFTMSYIITPLYVLLCTGLMIAFGLLINDSRHLIEALLCLFAMALLTLGLLLLVPYVKKKAIAHELARYDFDTAKLKDRDEWDFSDDDHQILFNRYGILLDGKLHYYNHIKKAVTVSNECQRVNIDLLFVIDEDTCGSVPLTASALKTLRQFGIQLINQKTLDYIVGHKEQAFREIYQKGSVTVG